MTPEQTALAELAHATLNRLAKWRSVFAGWQLGTRLDTDPESKAVRDHREATIMLRVEFRTLTTLLIEKNIITKEEFTAQIIKEAEILMKEYERKFPGFKATDDGIHMNVALACDTMQGWRP